MTVKSNKWIIDKHIPLAFIFAVIVQTGGAFWWASAISSAVNQNAKDIEIAKIQIMQNQKQTERIIRLEVKQEAIEKKIGVE